MTQPTDAEMIDALFPDAELTPGQQNNQNLRELIRDAIQHHIHVNRESPVAAIVGGDLPMSTCHFLGNQGIVTIMGKGREFRLLSPIEVTRDMLPAPKPTPKWYNILAWFKK